MLQPTPTMTTTESTMARDRGIAPALLIGGTFLLTTVANFLFNAASAIWDLQESFGAGGLSRADQLPSSPGSESSGSSLHSFSAMRSRARRPHGAPSCSEPCRS
jgi:hypothetical protein